MNSHWLVYKPKEASQTKSISDFGKCKQTVKNIVWSSWLSSISGLFVQPITSHIRSINVKCEERLNVSPGFCQLFLFGSGVCTMIWSLEVLIMFLLTYVPLCGYNLTYKLWRMKPFFLFSFCITYRYFEEIEVRVQDSVSTRVFALISFMCQANIGSYKHSRTNVVCFLSPCFSSFADVFSSLRVNLH